MKVGDVVSAKFYIDDDFIETRSIILDVRYGQAETIQVWLIKALDKNLYGIGVLQNHDLICETGVYGDWDEQRVRRHLGF